MYSKRQLGEKIQSVLVWIVFAQVGLLCGIEGIYVAVFAGMDDFERAYNRPSLSMLGVATSMYPIMAAIGALSVLFLVRVVAENVLLMISLHLWLAGYLTGSLCLGNMGALVTARALKGLAIGVITGVIPLYADRVTLTRQRAAQLLTLFQAAVPLGIVLMALIGKLATGYGLTMRWIYVAIPVFPANLFVFYLPRQLQDTEVCQQEIELKAKEGIWQHAKQDFRRLFSSRTGTIRFAAATLAQCASPLTAINVVFYYSSAMCAMLGFDPKESGYMAMGLYACNFVGTAASLGFINKLPRVVTIRYSVLSMAASHGATFVILLVQSRWPENPLWGLIAIALLFMFVLVFALLYAGMSLVYTSEVVSPQSRGISIGLATALGWVVNFTISMASPAIMQKIGFFTFLIFTYICCGLYLVFGLMPKPYTIPEAAVLKHSSVE